MKRRHAVWAGCLTLAGFAAARGDDPPARPALTVRLVEPDREMDRLLALFRGSRATSPADAMAAWKRASTEPKRLGKPLEAALAALNPAMSRELRSLDGAALTIPALSATPPLPWTLVLPRDDGTFAALGSAMVLTDGAEEPALNGTAVDRLGPPGSALMARGPAGLVIAGTRDSLSAGFRPDLAPIPGQLALRARIDPRSGTGPARWLPATGWNRIEVDAGLVGSSWQLRATIDSVAPAPDRRLDPAWLDLIPRDRAGAAVALALDPSAWDAGFAIVDRAERATPGHETVAPARLRLGTLARLMGVRLDADVIPHLRGVVAWVDATGFGVVAGFFDREQTSRTVQDRLAPRAGMKVDRRGAILLIGSDPASLAATWSAADHPDQSAGPALRIGWTEVPPARAGAIWPGRWPGLVPQGTPLAEALASAPPVRWSGRDRAGRAEDRVEWADLDGLVRRFLDRIPLRPSPDP